MIEAPLLEARHQELAVRVDRFTRQLSRTVAEDDSHARRLVALLAAQGLLEYTVPKPFGGPTDPLDVRAMCVIREHLSYESSLADLMFAMQGLGSFPITLAASEEIKQRFLPRVASGKAIAAFAITEPEAGSDVSAIQTTARRDGASYVIDGGKTFISNAGLADFYTVFAKTRSRQRQQGHLCVRC